MWGETARRPLSFVMPVLGTGIHEFRCADRETTGKLVDPKAKPWDDGVEERP
jgi:hypothetical protein